MKRASLYAVAWLVFTVGVLLFHSGCGSATKPSTAKPEPLETKALPLTCLQVFRGDLATVVFCGSEKMCDHVHQKMDQWWPDLERLYGVTNMSACTKLNTTFTER